MTLDNNGNVGIGTSFPSVRLHVNNTSSTANGMILNTQATTGSYYLLNATAAGMSRFYVRADGNVGIGLTAPNSQLHLSNTVANRKLILYEDADNDHQFFGFGINAGTFRYQLASTSSSHVFYSAASSGSSNELFRIHGGGNIGIGVSSPSQKLELKDGNMLISNSGTAGELRFAEPSAGGSNYTAFKAQTQASNITYTLPAADGSSGQVLSTNGSGTLSWSSAAGGGLSGSGTATRVAFWNGSSSLSSNANLYWDNTNSRLGIGTASPNQQLELTASLRLPETTSSTAGVIYKGTEPFIHNYKPASNDGFNTFIGVNSGNFTMSSITASWASYNTAVGYGTLFSNSSGRQNTTLGYLSLNSNTDGDDNTAIGFSSMNSNLTGWGNVAVGSKSLSSNTAGYANTVSGYYAMNSNLTGSYNAAFGAYSLDANTSGLQNCAFGGYSLSGNLSGHYNSAFGHYSAGLNTTGQYNTAIGYRSLLWNSTGNYNTVLGGYAAYSSTGNSQTANTIIGYKAGFSVTTGSNNILFGYQAGDNLTSGSNNILIGYDIDAPSATANSQMVLGNQSTLYGDLSNNRLGFGTTSPSQKLELKDGNLLISNSGTAGEIRFAEPSASGSNYTAFKAQAQAADLTYTLPSAYGAAGQVLTTDATGTLSWTTSGTGTVTGSGTATRVAFWNGTSSLSSNSNLYWDNVNNKLSVNSSISTIGNPGFYWNNGDTEYGIYKESGAWTSPYPDLRISFHTGIKLGANFNYGGTRFYNNSDMATEIFSVGNGDNNVRVNYALYSPIIYDLNNSGFYLDPASTSVLNVCRASIFYDYDNTSYMLDPASTGTSALFAGKVGIGSISASQKLEIKDGNVLLSNAGTAGEIRLAEPSAYGSNYTAFKAQAQAADVTYTLPTSDGSGGQVLATNGSGTLSWTTQSAGDITAVGSMTSGAVFANATADNQWLGLGAAAGRIEFDDQATDEVNILNARVGIGTSTPGQQLELTASIELPATTSSTTGVIYKGSDRFIHNYKPASNDGYNTFVGVNSGNFTMGNAANSVYSSYNTALGHSSLSLNTTGSYNSALGYGSLGSNTSGSSNTAIGYLSMNLNTTGYWNAAIGMRALQANISGYENTALGFNALRANTSGFNNVAIGSSSLESNTIGAYNVAISSNSLASNTKGDQNIAIGLASLQNNTTSGKNIAIGYLALNTQSFSNTNVAWDAENFAVGNSSLYSNQPTATTNGTRNTGTGHFSLYDNTIGYDNAAIGYGALNSNTNGNNNTALGCFAGSSVVSGSNCTYIGANSTLTTNRTNVSMFGYGIVNGQCTGNNQVLLGNTSVTSIRAAVAGITAYSDERYKTNINDNVAGLDFILKLKPVTYTVRPNELYKIWETPDSLVSLIDFVETENDTCIGFLAQEVEKAAKESGFNFPGLEVPKNENEVYALRYVDFIMPLVKAVQEQQQMIETLKEENGEIDKLKAEVEELRQLVLALKASVSKE